MLKHTPKQRLRLSREVVRVIVGELVHAGLGIEQDGGQTFDCTSVLTTQERMRQLDASRPAGR